MICVRGITACLARRLCKQGTPLSKQCLARQTIELLSMVAARQNMSFRTGCLSKGLIPRIYVLHLCSEHEHSPLGGAANADVSSVDSPPMTWQWLRDGFLLPSLSLFCKRETLDVVKCALGSHKCIQTTCISASPGVNPHPNG